jgi:hypothetical protein
VRVVHRCRGFVEALPARRRRLAVQALDTCASPRRVSADSPRRPRSPSRSAIVATGVSPPASNAATAASAAGRSSGGTPINVATRAVSMRSAPGNAVLSTSPSGLR